MASSGRLVTVPTTGGLRCPFLYQTRTILSQPPRCRQFQRSISASSSQRKEESSDQPDRGRSPADPAKSNSFLKLKAAQVSSNKQTLGSSITPVERAAFDSIWSLFEQPSPSTPKARATSTNHTDTDYKNILDLFSTPESLGEAQGNSTTRPDDNDTSQTTTDVSPEGNRPRPNRISSSHPTDAPSKLTRESAMAEIRGFLKDTTTKPPTATTLTSSPTNHPNETQTTALRLVEDAADSLTAALNSTNPRPEIAMWKVASEKVFPLIKLLRPSPSTLSNPLPSSTPAPDKLQSQNQAQTHPLIPASLPLLPLLSQTYPSLTLLTLRLYATHHPTSPYALALLPTLKSLGPTSYVLGAHTHFYNTLLSLYWRMYSDLRGMNTLLDEMEANGVEFDIGTWEVLRSVGEDREKDLDGRGERGRPWWARMEQAVWWPRVGVEWKEMVKRRLEQKGVSTGEVMREERGELGHGGRRTDDYVVTL